MNDRLLKIFTVVYEKQNMTLASEALFISQPSVSNAIKELEEFYNIKLFERYPKKLYPTQEGEILYNYGTQILGLYEQIHREFLLMSEYGHISVGANITAGTMMMQTYIDAFHKMYPDVRVKVVVAGSAELSRMLLENELDLALMDDLYYEKGLVQKPFYQDRIVLVASPGHPLAKRKRLKLENLAEENFLLRSKGVGARDQFDYLMKRNGHIIEPLWESANTKALVNAARAGYGIAVLPYLMVKKDIEEGSVVQLNVKDPSLNRSLNITYSRNKVFNNWIKYFIKVVNTISIEEDEL